MKAGVVGLRLDVEDLACNRGERRIFSGVSFSLAAGEALIVTGRNGAGKSTLLDLLAGRLHPAAGRVALSGAGDRTLAECLHYVGHRDALKSALTAREGGVALEIERQRLAMQEARARMEVAGRAVAAAEKAYEITRAKLELGRAIQVEVESARLALERALGDRATAENDLRLARARLERAVGGD